MACSTPGFPVHHQLLEFTQTHVCWVGDAIQPPHTLPSWLSYMIYLLHVGNFTQISVGNKAKYLLVQVWLFSYTWKWELEGLVINPFYVVYFIGRENSFYENGQSDSFGVINLLIRHFSGYYISPEKGRFFHLVEGQRWYKIGKWHSGSTLVKAPNCKFHLALQCVHFHWVPFTASLPWRRNGK